MRQVGTLDTFEAFCRRSTFDEAEFCLGGKTRHVSKVRLQIDFAQLLHKTGSYWYFN